MGGTVAEYGYVTAWTGVRTGRERQAMELWADAIGIYDKAKANGQIEDFEAVLYQPTGGAVPGGIITLWGSQDQVDAMRRDQDRIRLQARALILLEGLVETTAMRGGAVLEMMGLFDEVSRSLD